ncbi:hypothetical protein HSX10_10175 [Winogradskyella undariae]|nr:hypothetical protein [Winogradskyella undariae]NRR91930.1 hypothetical protein [Winogradskyella undariae]
MTLIQIDSTEVKIPIEITISINEAMTASKFKNLDDDEYFIIEKRL